MLHLRVSTFSYPSGEKYHINILRPSGQTFVSLGLLVVEKDEYDLVLASFNPNMVIVEFVQQR